MQLGVHLSYPAACAVNLLTDMSNQVYVGWGEQVGTGELLINAQLYEPWHGNGMHVARDPEAPQCLAEHATNQTSGCEVGAHGLPPQGHLKQCCTAQC